MPRDAPDKPELRERKTPPMTHAQIGAFLSDLARATPDAKTELEYDDPFTLLVSVVLAAQATDASVNRAMATLRPLAPTPAAMVALGEAGIAAQIRTIGLWQAKTKNVLALSQALIDRHAAQVPDDRAALEALPGVGRKTVNVVLSVIFGQPTMAVDTHVFRLGNRTGLAPGRDVRAVEDGLLARIPAAMILRTHHWLILHGRYVCKARTPECWRCVASIPCRYPDKTPTPVAKIRSVRTGASVRARTSVRARKVAA